MKQKLIIVIGVIIVGLLIFFNYYTKIYFENNNKIMEQFNKLKQLELRLNYEILSDSVYLYRNFDEIVKIEKDILKITKNLESDNSFKQHKIAYQEFLKYKKDIGLKIKKVYRLETFIAPIKNATMYLSELVLRLSKLPLKDKVYKKHSLMIISEIYLTKNSFDLSFLSELKKKLEILESIKRNSKEIVEFDKVFRLNVKLFIEYFPYFIDHINEVLHFKTQTELEDIINKFLISTNKKLKIITIVSVLLILFVITSIIVIYYLFFQLAKDNRKLEEMLISDKLTNLFNRFKLENDIEKLVEPLLFIVNIDKFKYYNDFYGVKAGDFILQETAKYIKKIFPKELEGNFYRIGADDFGILLENEDKNIDVIKIAEKIDDSFKRLKIPYNKIEFDISVSIGISKIKPLIESADIALKESKNRHKNIALYDKNSNHLYNIQENIKKITILKSAINSDNILPYFQPIYSNKTGKIVKYEVLARVIDGDRVGSIFPFLEIAKENKVYKYITRMIYQKSFEKFKDSDVEFSLNVSLEDIENSTTISFIERCLDSYPDVAKNLTFEILEDDAVANYDSLKNFITFVKSKGVKIAIDDFGSGYSNFAHILNLDIDFIKIDGSLIKNLDKDEKMEMIVETIVDFARKIDVQIIAEFVHSAEILEKVKNLKIDYTQGFYLGEPKEDICED